MAFQAVFLPALAPISLFRLSAMEPLHLSPFPVENDGSWVGVNLCARREKGLLRALLRLASWASTSPWRRLPLCTAGPLLRKGGS